MVAQKITDGQERVKLYPPKQQANVDELNSKETPLGAQAKANGARDHAVLIARRYTDDHIGATRDYVDVRVAEIVAVEGWTFADPLAWDTTVEYPPRRVVDYQGAYYVSTATTQGDRPDLGLPWSAIPTAVDADHRGNQAVGANGPHSTQFAAYFARDGQLYIDATHPNYGVVGDGTTDDTVALQAALDAYAGLSAIGTRGATALIPGGKVVGVSAQIVVPDRVVLRSVGRGAAVIKALAAFPISTAMIRLGAHGAAAFGTRVENLYVNCNDIAGSTAIYSDSAQEQSGVRHVAISGYRAYGVNLDQGGAGSFGSQNYFVEHVEVEPSSSADSLGGVRCAGAIGAKQLVQGVTHNSPAAIAAQPAGVIIDGAHVAVRDVHSEDCVNAVLFTGTARGSADNISGAASVTSCVRIETAQSVRVGVVNKAGATNAIVDSTRNRTITDSNVSSYDTHRATRGVTRLHLTANKSVADGFLMSDIAWGAASFDPESNWNGTTAYVCDNAGYYRVAGQIQWAAQAGTGQKVGVDVRIGGAEKAYIEEQSVAGQVHTVSFSDILFASAPGQSIVIQAAQDSDSGLARDVLSGAARTFLTVEYIGV